MTNDRLYCVCKPCAMSRDLEVHCMGNMEARPCSACGEHVEFGAGYSISEYSGKRLEDLRDASKEPKP